MKPIEWGSVHTHSMRDGGGKKKKGKLRYLLYTTHLHEMDSNLIICTKRSLELLRHMANYELKLKKATLK